MDARYTPSRQICISSARQLLDLANSATLEATWGSATAICADLMFDSSREQSDADQRRVQKRIRHLQSFAKVSTVARRGWRLLSFLLDKIQARSASSPGARETPPPPQRRHFSSASDSTSTISSSSSTRSSAEPMDGSLDYLKHKTPVPLTASLPTRPSPPSTSSAAERRTIRKLSAALSTPSTSSPALPLPPLADVFRSAADDLAALDFAALLGVERQSGIFTFGSGEGEGRKAG
ncbi:hypothetical protein JCM10207_002166 [Rhodosporidiobolus poonsookiae]